MTKKNQQQNTKHPYASPTTPGLYVTFRAYIIELICLNVNKKIGPRFWSDQKYWGPKFRREVKGVANVCEQLGDTGTLTETAFIHVITLYNIKSLSYKTTVNKVVKNIHKKKIHLEQQREQLRHKKHNIQIDIKKNSTFVDTGPRGILSKIREAENG